jgi:thermitase
MAARFLLRLGAPLAATALLAMPATAAIAPDASLGAQGWAPLRVNAAAAWATASPAQPPITIAVVDTGVDFSSPDLAGKLVTGYDAADGSTPSSDTGWHGTAVASIAGGISRGEDGVTSYCGQCSVMPVKALDVNGQGSDGAIARGIRWAVDRGARVVNLSLAGPAQEPSLPAAIRYADRHGVVVVAAAGNDGTSARSFPAADPFAIGVAATDPTDHLYSWSNRGRWVTVAAPGINASAVPGGGVFSFMGTSSAAALVSGVVGMCLTSAPTLTPALVRRALVAGAAPVVAASFGRIDAGRTVALCRTYAAAQ